MPKIAAFVVCTALNILPGGLLAESGACPPAGYTLESLQQLRQAGFAMDSAERTNALAIALLACVGHPDPAVRDGVVYEGLSTWMRARRLSSETIHALYSGLVEQLRHSDDPNGFEEPFAALILSEVARTDRIDHTLTSAMRDELVGVAAHYLSSVRDYRGFSATEGWRHGVAHGSDLVLQLALNPRLDARQVERLMTAVASQVAPVGEVFYIFGEPGRLARAAFYAYGRNDVEAAFWNEWFSGISAPGPLENWAASWSSREGLARRHNTRAFLLALHFSATANPEQQASGLVGLVEQAMTRLSGG